ncbi:MAG: Dna2/Cas4 domain-containing protein [ANME-2 cluster archaeon]|nr:Dna2/Cas4 domain-containing protein [ANME-2 cluster archaeon]
MEDYVRVSDITNYLKCPRMVYYGYQEQGHNQTRPVTPSYVAALIIKEMAQGYAEVVESEDMVPTLQSLLDMSAHQITIIYRDELADIDLEIISHATAQVHSQLHEIMNGIKASMQSLGVERLLDIFTPMEVEPLFYSEKMRISGSPDRLSMHDGAVTPSVIRTGQAPQNGVWKNDRVRLTALSILLGDKYDCTVEKGVVEYARYGIVREVPIQRADRRKVLTLAGRVRKIRDGRLPDKPGEAPCEYCEHIEYCQVTQTLASRFF